MVDSKKRNNIKDSLRFADWLEEQLKTYGSLNGRLRLLFNFIEPLNYARVWKQGRSPLAAQERLDNLQVHLESARVH